MGEAEMYGREVEVIKRKANNCTGEK